MVLQDLMGDLRVLPALSLAGASLTRGDLPAPLWEHSLWMGTFWHSRHWTSPSRCWTSLSGCWRPYSSTAGRHWRSQNGCQKTPAWLVPWSGGRNTPWCLFCEVAGLHPKAAPGPLLPPLPHQVPRLFSHLLGFSGKVPSITAELCLAWATYVKLFMVAWAFIS